MHYGPAVQTVSGNWVAGMHKGVIGGVDFGSTGGGQNQYLLYLHVELVRKRECLHAHGSHGTSLYA